MKHIPRRALAVGLFIASLALVSGLSSPRAVAQNDNPWTLGIVDASFIWTPPPAVAASIPKCAYEIAKQNGLTSGKPNPYHESPIQLCLVQKMHAHGASKNAVAFSKWYFDEPYGNSAYITAVAKPQYGVVQLASIVYPGNANNDYGYLFVNGTNPRITNPEDVFAPAGQPWKHDPAFQSIVSAHPNAFVFPALSFVNVVRREGGGQRFTLAAPILDGCHACAQLGTVEIAYDFGNLGAPKGATVVAVKTR